MALNIIMGSNGTDDDTMISRWKAAHFEGNSDKALWLLLCPSGLSSFTFLFLHLARAGPADKSAGSEFMHKFVFVYDNILEN